VLRAFAVLFVLTRAQLAAELARLDRAAAAEEQRSPVRPAPSRERAFQLILSFAKGDGAALGVTRPGRLWKVADDLWIWRTETVIQDKSGSYELDDAWLYVMTDGSWKQIGWGEATRAR
jgi:hypothetical protein